MKKIFSLFIAALFSVAMFAATETTVYYTAPAETIGTYTVKCNTNQQTNPDAWHSYTMRLTDTTYNSNPVYEAKFTDLWDGLDRLQFQLYDGEEWKSQEQPISSWVGQAAYNGKMWIHGGSQWVDLSGDAPDPTVAIKGGWDGWAVTTPFELSANKETATVTLVIEEEETFEFGLEVNSAWTANGVAFTRVNPANEVVAGSGGNLTLNVDQAGSYTFTWTFATNTLAVTYPTLLRKFFITGDSAFVVNAGLTVDKKWNPKAFKSEADSYTFKNLAAGIYSIKITIDGTWDTAKGYDDLSDKTDAGLTSNDGNISFRLLEPADVTVTYTADPAVFTVTTTGSFFSKEAGYYLIGEFSGVEGWAVENLVAEKKFTETVEDGQYSLLVTLAVGDLIKVVEVENNAIKTWYGNTNYEITDAYAGKKIIYFKPAGDESWEQLDGHIWIGDDPTTALDEVEGGVKAVKRVVNGQLVIEREGKFYNALGAEVK